MSLCAYCGRRLPLLHRVLGNTSFCSKRHAELHAQELDQLALEALDRLRPVAKPVTEEAAAAVVAAAEEQREPSRTTEAEVPCEAPALADPDLAAMGMGWSGVVEPEVAALVSAGQEPRLPGVPRQEGSTLVPVAGWVRIPNAEAVGGAAAALHGADPAPVWGRQEAQMPGPGRPVAGTAELVAEAVKIPEPEALSATTEILSGARPLPPRRRLLGPSHRPGRVDLSPVAAESLLPVVVDGLGLPEGAVQAAATAALRGAEGMAMPRVPASSPVQTGLSGWTLWETLEALPEVEPVADAMGARAVECKAAAPGAVEPEFPARGFRRGLPGALPPLSAYDGPQEEFFAVPGARGLWLAPQLSQLAADAGAVGLELDKKPEALVLRRVAAGKMRRSESDWRAAPPACRLGELPAAALFVPVARLMPLRPACCFGPMPSSGEGGGRAAAVLPFRVEGKAGVKESQPAKIQGRR
jgi:hypothetical protein